MGVIVLDLFIHPPKHCTDFRRIMAGISYYGVDDVPETVRCNPPVTRFDPGSFQCDLESFVPPGFADAFPVVVTEEKIIRLDVTVARNGYAAI